MHLNKPLVPKDPEGNLQVISIGRVSTPTQPLANVDASHDYVVRLLQAAYSGKMSVKRFGECASGMLAERATIQEALELIESGLVDVVAAEDLSRIYRNPQFQFAFVHTCVDTETRLICPGDNLDTGDDNWEVAMQTAVLRHGLHTPDTIRRIRRTATFSFKNGGMVQKIRFGYRKLSKHEADLGQFGPKGLRLAKVCEWTPVIREMWAKTIAGWDYESIADWLRHNGIPTGPYSKCGRWTGVMVKNLLEDDILWGQRTFQRTIYTRILRTGKFKRKKNPKPETEYVPELAHISQEEHATLKQVMLRRKQDNVRGNSKSNRRGVRRGDNYWPAQHAECAICHDPCHCCGATFLKCRNAHEHGDRRCWNHVRFDGALLRKRFFEWLDKFLDPREVRRKLLLDVVWQQLQRARRTSQDITSRRSRAMSQLNDEQRRLVQAIRAGGKIPVLVEELKSLRAKLSHLAQEQSSENGAGLGFLMELPRDGVDARLSEVLTVLCRTSFEFSRLMRRFVSTFSIQPIQALDCDQVRPRARLTVCFERLLDWSSGDWATEDLGQPATVDIDLFDPPKPIEYLSRCVELKTHAPSITAKAIARHLGIGHMTAKRALDYSRLMQALGVTEPYRVITECPENASRWKPRSRKTVDNTGLDSS